jgi:hypothetical protein
MIEHAAECNILPTKEPAHVTYASLAQEDIPLFRGADKASVPTESEQMPPHVGGI